MENSVMPLRLFKEGAEPNGERVQSYSELAYLEGITSSLLPEDLNFLRSSQFGKLLEIVDGSAFSGKLVHFLLTHQLVVKKKAELWVVFAGSPIRFSLSEFQMVTGLNCEKPPNEKARKRKRVVGPGRYWYSLFERPDVSVEWVVSRLKKRLVPDRDTRIRYALLAIIDGVLCPTSGKAKISPVHVDMVADISKFLEHPWGTKSFQMTLASIKARGPEKLNKKSVSLQGFPHALQMVLLQCVPNIRELQFPEIDVDEYSDIEEEVPEPEHLWNLKLDIVWKVDAKAKCNVTPILAASAPGQPSSSSSWMEDEEDSHVDNMVKLISNGHKFTTSMFSGGLLSAEVSVEQNDNSDVGSTHDSDAANNLKAEKKSFACKKSHNVEDTSEHIEKGIKQYVDMRAQLLEKRLLQAIEDAEVRLQTTFATIESRVNKRDTQSVPGNIVSTKDTEEPSVRRGEENLGLAKDASTGIADNIIGSVLAAVDKTVSVKEEQPVERLWHSILKRCGGTAVDKLCVAELKASPSLLPSKRRKSLSADADVSTAMEGQVQSKSDGKRPIYSTDVLPEVKLSGVQSETVSSIRSATFADDHGDVLCEDLSTTIGGMGKKINVANLPAVDSVHSMSDSPTIVSRVGYDVEQMQKLCRITASMGEIDFGVGRQLSSREVLDILELKSPLTPPIMDLLLNTVRIGWEAVPHVGAHESVAFLDATFVSELLKHYTKFTKSTDKGMYAFDEDILSCTPTGIERVYMSFMADKQHWVGLCVHLSDWRIYVIDCFTSSSREQKLKSVVNPLGEMLPYLIRYATGKGGKRSGVYKPMSVQRLNNIPQACFGRHSGVMSALLLQRHAVGGVEACKDVNINDVFDAAKKFIVTAYELANTSP